MVNLLGIGIFILFKFPNNPLVSCSLRNSEFLLLYTKHFHETIILPFLVFTIFGFFMYFFYTSNNQIDCFIYSLNFYFSLKCLISSFISSNSCGTLFTKTDSSWLILESIETLEIKISTLFKLDCINDNTLSCFFFFFLIIDL